MSASVCPHTARTEKKSRSDEMSDHLSGPDMGAALLGTSETQDRCRSASLGSRIVLLLRLPAGLGLLRA